MMEKISVVFLLLSIILLLTLFYIKDNKLKIFLCLQLSLFLASFFIGSVSTKTYEINILVVLGMIGMNVFFLKDSNIINVCIFTILLTIIYIFILNQDNLYLTSFNFYPILWVGVFFNILFSKNYNDLISNAITSGISFESLNFIYFQNFFGFAGSFDFSFLSFVLDFVLYSLALYFLLSLFKKLFIRRKNKCTPIESQF